MIQPIDELTQKETFVSDQKANDNHCSILSKGDTHLLAEQLTACLAEIQQQNEDALSQFYDLTINRVYGLALRITGKAEEAEEVVSDVYLQLWNQADRYKAEKGSIMTWLLTLCHSRAIDRWRKRQQSSSEISTTECSDLIDLVANPEYLLVHS